MSKKELTLMERCAVIDALESVKHCMEFDEDADEYRDHENFVMAMTKEEYKALCRAIKKMESF